MPIRIFNDGERPSASDFNRYFLQQHSVIKPSDESVSSSTTFQDDNHLRVPVEANTEYWVWCMIFYTGPSTNGDLKLRWQAPSGSVFSWLSDSLGSGATGTVTTVSRNDQFLTSTPAPGTTGNDAVAPIKGLLKTDSFAGDFYLTWAQLASSATAVTILADSTLILRRLTD